MRAERNSFSPLAGRKGEKGLGEYKSALVPPHPVSPRRRIAGGERSTAGAREGRG
jgi:hypothetical protein